MCRQRFFLSDDLLTLQNILKSVSLGEQEVHLQVRVLALYTYLISHIYLI